MGRHKSSKVHCTRDYTPILFDYCKVVWENLVSRVHTYIFGVYAVNGGKSVACVGREVGMNERW